MSAVSSATPLIALDALVIDTETTGLDPARARILEIGAVRIAASRPDDEPAFRTLVQPGEPIPPVSTSIHHIDDAAVASAPDFAAVWPDFSALIEDEILIGHSLGYDFAILKRECDLAGLEWKRPRALDTQLLAQVAEPNLGGYGLDHLAAWLGIEVTGRHSAVADATVTAKVFVALLPKLREGNIRTLAEAEAACHALTHVLEDQHRAGWEGVTSSPSQSFTAQESLRIDSYRYLHRVSAVMSTPRYIAPQQTIEEAAACMASAQVSSLFVSTDSANALPQDTGILTERDVLRVLARHGAGALAMPVEHAASRPLQAVPADAFIYRAIARLNRLKLRHLGVFDESGRIVGALSARDLLRLRGEVAVELGDEIDDAAGVADLARAWTKLPQVAAALLAEGVEGRSIAAVISRELSAATRQAAVIAEARMHADGLGPAPCRYAVCVLGSVGREESLLAMDQDNAIVFAEGAPDGDEDRWFAQLGKHIADILNEVGIPYCTGGVMASNPQWRGSMATWRARIAEWIGNSRPDDLLSVDIFFDLRAAHGDGGLANELWRSAFDAAKGNAAFAKLLAEAAQGSEVAFNFLGRLRTAQGRIDLKRTGLFGIVTAARIMAIRHHVVERSTVARLTGVMAVNQASDADLESLLRAHGDLVELILRQQISDIEHGLPPTNCVAVSNLSREERLRLVAALHATEHIDTLMRDQLF